MAWILQILGMLVKLILPAIIESRKPTAEDGMRQPELRARLRKRIRKTWRPAAKATVVLLAVAMLAIAGCGRARTIIVPAGEPVQLRKTIKNAAIWVVDANGKRVESKADLPAGWYCLPDAE